MVVQNNYKVLIYHKFYMWSQNTSVHLIRCSLSIQKQNYNLMPNKNKNIQYLH